MSREAKRRYEAIRALVRGGDHPALPLVASVETALRTKANVNDDAGDAADSLLRRAGLDGIPDEVA